MRTTTAPAEGPACGHYSASPGTGPAGGHRSAAMSGRVGVARNSALRRRTSSWSRLLEASAAADVTAFHGSQGRGNSQVFLVLQVHRHVAELEIYVAADVQLESPF